MAEAVVMENLPEEIIIDIFLRLPVKSLMGLRCVSKHWLDFISNPSFINRHLNLSIETENIGLFLSTKHNSSCPVRLYCVQGNALDEEAIEIEDPLNYCSYFTEVLGFCNGLVCFANDQDLCILNPTTREYKIINNLGQHFNYDADTVYGFGYDPITQDYKLVQILDEYYVRRYGRGSNQMNNYSLGDASCLNIFNIPYNVFWNQYSSSFWDKTEPGIYVNGFLHWIALPKDELTKAIFSLDLSNMVFQEVPLPDEVSESCKIGMREKFERYVPVDMEKSQLILGVLRGQLCMLCKANDIDIWVMDKYGKKESWMKLFSMPKTVLPTFLNSRPLCVFKNGEILLKDGSDLVLYDPVEKTARNFTIRGISDWSTIYKIMNHVVSLVPLNSGTYAAGTIIGVDEKEQA